MIWWYLLWAVSALLDWFWDGDWFLTYWLARVLPFGIVGYHVAGWVL